MITCNPNQILELNNNNIKNLSFDDIVCYTFVGGNPGNTQGDVYIFILKNKRLYTYRGNVFDGKLDSYLVYELIPEADDFFNKWSFNMCPSGWQGIA